MTPEPGLMQIVEVFNRVGLAGILLCVLFGSYRGIWVWGREYRKLEKERDEWKTLAMRHLGIAETATRLSVPTP